MSTLYTVSRCKPDNTFYGPLHGSTDSYTTICGQTTDERWWILNNTFDGEITCKKCLSVLAESNEKVLYY